VKLVVAQIVRLGAIPEPCQLNLVCRSPVAQKHKDKTFIGRFLAPYFRESQGFAVESDAFFEIPDIDVIVVKLEIHFPLLENQAGNPYFASEEMGMLLLFALIPHFSQGFYCAAAAETL
jgi:hypothetical protein